MGTSLYGANDTSVVKDAKETVVALNKLIDTIEKNNVVTEEQNKKLVRLTWLLVVFTIVMVILGVIQVIGFFCN